MGDGVGRMDTYRVKKVDKPLRGTVIVPGSKSMTNRALLLAALSEEMCTLRGVLFSDDSRHFLDSLASLGYEIEANELEKVVRIQGCGRKIPKLQGTIDVGSAGTAARFLTAMLALSEGEYTINCSKQMEKRPMKELFKVLSGLGAEFTYLGQEGHLPVKVRGNGGICKDIQMDISKSTQYLSAMLMVAPVTENGMHIRITSEKKQGSYVKITMNMLKSFGVDVEFQEDTYYVRGKQPLHIGGYDIEPDVSAACYFYGMAALTGGSICVKNVRKTSMQGDMKFLHVLEQMGCKVEEQDAGICVSREPGNCLQGVDIDMNDFSDQALTLAALAPYAKGDTIIRNIGHIRGQECNRMQAIVNELTRCGVTCKEEGDSIYITPAKVQPAEIETYEDHRVAMSFTMLGLGAEGIVIKDPLCCRKTFEEYYDTLEKLCEEQ